MRSMAKMFAAALALCLAAALIAPKPADAAEKLTVLLDWFVNPDHATLFVAQEKGYFADAGLEVELIAPADPNDPPKLVAAEKADLAVSYQPQLHLQVAEGLPLVRVGDAGGGHRSTRCWCLPTARFSRSPISRGARWAIRSAASRMRCSAPCSNATA